MFLIRNSCERKKRPATICQLESDGVFGFFQLAFPLNIFFFAFGSRPAASAFGCVPKSDKISCATQQTNTTVFLFCHTTSCFATKRREGTKSYG